MVKQTEPQLSKWLHTRGVKLGLPVGGTFELTARCNFDCPMCYVHLKQQDIEAAGRELTADQWIQLARDARDRGMMFLLLTGGEPFVRKDFFEIYEAVRAMGIIVSINSNGSMLRGETLERLLENPPQRINISLYGGCGETYRALCGQDMFDTVTANIRALKEAGVDIRLNLSITPQNLADVRKIYELSRELNVQIKASSYMYPPVRSRNSPNARLSPEAAARAMAQWDSLRFSPEEFALRTQAMLSMSAPEERECAADLEEGVSCRAGRSTFWVTWDGRMLPCGMMPGPEANPLRDGFDAAWDTIKQQTRQIRLPEKCASCPKRQVCASCAAVRVAETGSFAGVPEYMCRMTEEMLTQLRQMQEERSKP